MLKLITFIALALSSCTRPCVCDGIRDEHAHDCEDFAARQCTGETCTPTSPMLSAAGYTYDRARFMANCHQEMAERFQNCVEQLCR